MAAPLPKYELRSQRFLQMCENSADRTWGFYIYGTYTRPQEDGNTAGQSNEEEPARFQALATKLQAHVTDYVRYTPDLHAAYKPQIIDALRLEPAAYLPGASLAEVCTHYSEHYVDDEDDEKYGPKYSWCLVVDDKALQTIESALEPIGPAPPGGRDPLDFMANAEGVFVTLLHKRYTELVKEPVVIAAQGRGGAGRTRTWEGWLRIYISDLMRVCEELRHGGDIEQYRRGPDNVLIDF
jgi:hypothetical protein